MEVKTFTLDVQILTLVKYLRNNHTFDSPVLFCEGEAEMKYSVTEIISDIVSVFETNEI